MDSRHKIGIKKTFWIIFIFIYEPPGGHRGHFRGSLYPKMTKTILFRHVILRDHSNRCFDCIELYFMHKTGIITIHFNCFLIHVATNRGHWGHFRGYFCPESQKYRNLLHLTLSYHPLKLHGMARNSPNFCEFSRIFSNSLVCFGQSSTTFW